jgi:hypothetical protein
MRWVAITVAKFPSLFSLWPPPTWENFGREGDRSQIFSGPPKNAPNFETPPLTAKTGVQVPREGKENQLLVKHFQPERRSCQTFAQ